MKYKKSLLKGLVIMISVLLGAFILHWGGVEIGKILYGFFY